MTKTDNLGLGLIGCGSFGMFCLEAFSQMDEVRIAGVADVARPAADAAAGRFGVPAFYNPAELLTADGVDIVQIATPPSSHFQLAMASISAGKHVLCEKPLAINTDQADDILAAAERAGVIAPVNFVLRYNRLTEVVKAILNSGVVGKALAARLTNCAFDTYLPNGHWFWDKSISGGIFIEHGVHFFDMYEYWLGPGTVIDACAEIRPGTNQEDRVACTVRHETGALVSHYHGFDQIKPMDRADHRIICEMGDIRVQGWIPMKLVVDAAVDDAGAAKLADCCRGCEVRTVATYGREEGSITGRGKHRNVTRR
ncbi:MAG: Gfo/Idh/MocA family oxidoreductase, partial [Phycisphaerae bacterium]|nr:Gfo/Idh/MocA family oxidoreductase [Phycisphaerae bacterium]